MPGCPAGPLAARRWLLPAASQPPGKPGQAASCRDCAWTSISMVPDAGFIPNQSHAFQFLANPTVNPEPTP